MTTGKRLVRSITEEEVEGYKKLNPKYELMALFPGIRVSNADFEDSFYFIGQDLADRRNYALSLYRRPLRAGEKELDSYREKSYEAYKNMFSELTRIYFNMIDLGADPKVLKDHLGGFNKEEKKYLLRKEVPPISILEPKK